MDSHDSLQGQKTDAQTPRCKAGAFISSDCPLACARSSVSTAQLPRKPHPAWGDREVLDQDISVPCHSLPMEGSGGAAALLGCNTGLKPSLPPASGAGVRFALQKQPRGAPGMILMEGSLRWREKHLCHSGREKGKGWSSTSVSCLPSAGR